MPGALERPIRRSLAVVLLATFALLFSVSAAWAIGELTQKPGKAGCISETGSNETCQDGRALDGAEGTAISPDGKSVYVVAQSADAVTIFDRDPETGELRQKDGEAGCTSNDGTDQAGGICKQGKALDFPRAVGISPDGKSVYVASAGSDAIAIFDRDTVTGELRQKDGKAGCVSETGSGETCQDGRALVGASGIAVTPDDKSVYVITRSGVVANAVTILDRDPDTGELTQKPGKAGCISETGSNETCQDGREIPFPDTIAASPDGNNVYVGSGGSDAVAIFDRDTATGELRQKDRKAGCISEDGSNEACQDGKALLHPNFIAFSPDGKSVYVSSFFGTGIGAVAVFDRNTATGELEQKEGEAACVSEVGSDDGCQDGKALSFAQGLAISPDGENVYVASVEFGVAILSRDPETGELKQKMEGTSGCIGTAVGCTPGEGLQGSIAITASADGKSVYAASLFSDTLAIFDRALSPTPPPPSVTTTELSCDDPVKTGQASHCTAQVTDSAADPSTPIGKVHFSANPTGSFSNGLGNDECELTGAGAPAACTIDFTTNTAGRQEITAEYLPDSNHAAGTKTIVIVVNSPSNNDKPGVSPPTPPPDPLPPVVSRFRLAPARFQAPPKGDSRFLFTLTELADVGVTIERALPGRKVGKRCISLSPKVAKQPPCTRFVRSGSLAFLDRLSGDNKIPFVGKLARALEPGAYQASIVATDPTGELSDPRRAPFTVLPRVDGFRPGPVNRVGP